MLKKLGSNLELLMSEANLNSNELAKKIGIPATTIKRIRTSQQANPTIATLIPISEFFSVSIMQLVGTEPLKSAKKTERVNTIPILSWTNCIDYNLLDYSKIINTIVTEKNISDKSYALTLESHDLEGLPSNCILIIDPEIDIHHGDLIIVVNTKYNIVSVRKYIIEIDQIYLKSLIAGAGVSVLNHDYKILGVIVQYKVELK